MEEGFVLIDAQRAKEAVACAGRRLLNTGLVARTWGNVSCRVDADTFAITPSGLGYEHMTADDVVLYHMESGAFEGAYKPSSEKGVHAAAYRRFPNARFVIHTHQDYASALGLAGYEPLLTEGAISDCLGGVARAEYGLPGTKRLVQNVTNAMEGGAHCVLMAHHGALIIGQSAEEAFFRAERLERACMAARKGQPEQTSETGDALNTLVKQLAADGTVLAADAPSVIAASMQKAGLCAQLDDMAQMLGCRIRCVKPNANAVARALQKRDAVFVEGLGAICRGKTEGDARALCLLVKKACVCFLHTRACGEKATLSRLDSALMHAVYRLKYAKKIGG